MLQDIPKVSIITVTYNSAATIKDTLQSVAQQDYGNIEHIIVDGLSSDNTVELVREFPHVAQCISERDKGMYDGLNKGIKMCTGKYVGILNSDDFFSYDEAISTVVEALESADTEAVFADVKYISPADETKIIRYCASKGWTPEKFAKGYMPNHPTYYTAKKNYDLHGYFELDYKICADYELLIKHLYKARLRYKYLPHCLVTMRPGGISNGSLSKRLTLNKEIVQACKAHGMNTNLLKLSGKLFSKSMEYINPKA